MTWIIGIDEAGYGPNLGPFVMSAVACRNVAQKGCDLWQQLRSAVRRAGEPDDGRLLIADSKVVYTPSRGLGNLETGVLAALPPVCPEALCLKHYLAWLSPASEPELCREPWYRGDTSLPVAALPEAVNRAGTLFDQACREVSLSWAQARSVVVCPERFNTLTEQAGSKGAVLQHGLASLIQSSWHLGDDGEPLSFFVDKHGGRSTYTAMLQDAIPEGTVVVCRESAACSTYRVHGLKREVRLLFQPRADAEHFCVALASMVSKYLREVLMGEFNRFWAEQVPGLKPTAGYPMDAGRFLTDIRPAAKRLGIPETLLWRRK